MNWRLLFRYAFVTFIGSNRSIYAGANKTSGIFKRSHHCIPTLQEYYWVQLRFTNGFFSIILLLMNVIYHIELSTAYEVKEIFFFF